MTSDYYSRYVHVIRIFYEHTVIRGRLRRGVGEKVEGKIHHALVRTTLEFSF